MMDNTRKRKIVRNFVIGYLLLQVLVIVLYLGFWYIRVALLLPRTNACLPRRCSRITKGLLYLII